MQAPPSHAPRAPPFRPSSGYSPFLIGRDSRGNWVVCDQAGLCGAVFVKRSEARRCFSPAGRRSEPRAISPSSPLICFGIFEGGERDAVLCMVLLRRRSTLWTAMKVRYGKASHIGGVRILGLHAHRHRHVALETRINRGNARMFAF